MLTKQMQFVGVAAMLIAGLCFGQQYPQQYPQPAPPPDGQYPQPQQQYPPQGQYPQAPQQNPQYPQGQYPPAQGYPQQPYPAANQPPPLVPPQQLDQMVASIALYPDGLLAHVLTAATFPDQIPEAAGWANQHAYLKGPALADAIRRDNLPWDVSVLALLPFPQVLSQMAQYMQWTEQLGNAVLVQRGDVMDAIQRLRARANQEGYLRDPQFDRYERVEVAGPNQIIIQPLTNDYYVPYYSPQIFFVRPHPGFYGVFSFGPAVSIGVGFAPFGWGAVGFGWREHSILFDQHPWERSWVNRGAYVHPYAQPYRRLDSPRVEQHEYRPAERGGDRGGDRGHDEHRDHDHH
jgi:hypothetical protein